MSAEQRLREKIAELEAAREKTVAGSDRHIANIRLIDAEVTLIRYLRERDDEYWGLQ